MSDLVRPLEQYWRDALGVRATLTPWPGQSTLPHLLRRRYACFQTRLAGAPLLVMADLDNAEAAPAAVAKHVAAVRERVGGEIVYARARMTAYHRRRLIEHKIPFVVPGNQMYLPMLGVDLREHFRQLRAERRPFTPATQAAVVHWLANEYPDGPLTPGAVAPILGYTPMTMTRVFNELEAAGLGIVTTEGRQRLLRLPSSARELWDAALPFLRSPVTKRIFVHLRRPRTHGRPAGLWALAQYSNIGEPENAVIAVGREQWRALRTGDQARPLPYREPDAVEVEVWSYSPLQYAEGETVDPFSLHLSLRDDPDARVEAALAEMMDRLPW